MRLKWMGPCGVLAVLLWMIPMWSAAQDYYRGEGGRGVIQVTNDWRDEVTLTMWTNNRERIGENWALESGETAFLAIGDQRIKVRPNYKIKVGNDWGWVNVGEVSQFRGGVWYVNVRDIWRATHRDRGNRPYGQRYDQQPDYLRP